ncbi:uncharacterized protein LOC105691729 [Athalia rosae]|uniref:uncharacterized protein LOC105691729 n=1 Tax=Athalia rosae TaxID=37344 RepID=UPI0020336AA1|nr:uncharacterized protein LOC105691729 [Athalia rosae]XP_048513089.1 uncharacterized protein LOC105691729 [Athalia rosae]XP_048513090.1 uncharacterized protein LOC105691729 [Athalia rosae]XP_048513091.1 uncharacterized protein LOC105691729 [Athalia rosae]
MCEALKMTGIKIDCRKFSVCIAFLAIISSHIVSAEKQKRQIFREQVLPARGGKIPEEAFRADRLALNRLNKEGITIPDGVVLDARHVQKHPQPPSGMPEVLKVYLTPEGRYVPPEGRYNYQKPKAIDTTYLAPHPVANNAAGGKFYGGNGYHNSAKKLHNYNQGHRYFGQTTRQQIYKPLPGTFVIPSNSHGNEYHFDNNYYPRWNTQPEYRWEIFYEPFDDDYFINSIALLNSHQIITDYEGFLNDFHDRSLRHIPEGPAKSRKGGNQAVDKFQDVIKTGGAATKSFPHDYNYRRAKIFGYPDIKEIPKTAFECGQKRGVFADAETKCQVFHQCGANGKNSFLCAPGTVFSESKRRCEWWDTVACDLERRAF